jgi:hypothetical protein
MPPTPVPPMMSSKSYTISPLLRRLRTAIIIELIADQLGDGYLQPLFVLHRQKLQWCGVHDQISLEILSEMAFISEVIQALLNLLTAASFREPENLILILAPF